MANISLVGEMITCWWFGMLVWTSQITPILLSTPSINTRQLSRCVIILLPPYLFFLHKQETNHLFDLLHILWLQPASLVFLETYNRSIDQEYWTCTCILDEDSSPLLPLHPEVSQIHWLTVFSWYKVVLFLSLIHRHWIGALFNTTYLLVVEEQLIATFDFGMLALEIV